MKLLILGGTRFLGRHLTEAALAGGHEVTLFNRGISESGFRSHKEVEQLRGDRDGSLEELERRQWDAVIDTSGYVPRVVGYSVERLKHSVQRYVFISSVSVYRDFSQIGIDEEAPLLQLEDESTEDVNAHYGALKALCEREVIGGFGARSLIIRPGLIVGPHDPTDRFTYWPLRFARGGQVLLPGRADRPVQFIDVRDLAGWTLQMAEAGASGIYNAIGPEIRFTMEELVHECLAISSERAQPVWAPEELLLQHGVQEWRDLPLWIAENRGWDGFLSVDGRKAFQAGLRCRPVRETVVDTLEWALSQTDASNRKAGLSPEREAELLQLIAGFSE